MPKIKTHSGAKKRLKKTANGKIKVKKSGTRHLKYGKSKSRQRRLNAPTIAHASNQIRLDRLLPNG